MIKIAFSPIYYHELPEGHRFPMLKYELIPEQLLHEGKISEYGLKAMGELDEKSLSKEFNWNGGKLNKYKFLNLIQDHQTHHVGQLIVYLKINNIEPPKYIGW